MHLLTMLPNAPGGYVCLIIPNVDVVICLPNSEHSSQLILRLRIIVSGVSVDRQNFQDKQKRPKAIKRQKAVFSNIFSKNLYTCVGMTWSRISNQGGPDCCFPHLSIPVCFSPLSEAIGDSSSVCVDDSYARIYEHLSYLFSFYTVELYMFVFCFSLLVSPGWSVL